MAIPITSTKIIVPKPQKGLISRTRLIHLLTESLDKRLILISAPAGYGKTSLMVDFAWSVKQPLCWFSIDNLDRDPRRFLSHFIAAIERRFPGFGGQSSASLRDVPDSRLDYDRISTHIVNEAVDHIKEPYLLILDDVHQVDGIHEIWRFLDLFIQKVDDNCLLLLSSRTLPVLRVLPNMVARNQVAGLSFEELAFRPVEIQSLVRKNFRIRISQTEAENIAQESEGWVAGLLMSASSTERKILDRLRLARVSGVGLYEYLAQEVLDQQPPEIRDFLLRTSLLDDFNAEVCAAVLGSEWDWETLITAVVQRNLFIVTVGERRRWYRYHQLFRDFLQECLRREQPDVKEQVTRNLAKYYQDQAAWTQAYALYHSIMDRQALVNLIKHAGRGLIERGQFGTLHRWFVQLSDDELILEDPVLTSLLGITYVIMGEPERGLHHLDRAIDHFMAQNDQKNLADAYIRRTFAHRFLGDYHASLADAEAVLALGGDGKGISRERADALRAKGMNLAYLGNLTSSLVSLEASLQAYKHLEDEMNVALTHIDLGFVNNNAGKIKRALSHYEPALAYWRRQNNIVHQAILLNNIGVAYHLQGDYLQASYLLEESLQCANRSGYKRAEALSYTSLGDLYQDIEAYEAALEAYRRARAVAELMDYSFLALYLDLAEANIAQERGDVRLAEKSLREAKWRSEKSQSKYEHALYKSQIGNFSLNKGEIEIALQHLTEAAILFKEGGQKFESMLANLHLANCFLARGDDQRAKTYLDRVLEINRETDNCHFLVVKSRPFRSQLETFAKDSEIGDQIDRLLDRIFDFDKQVPALRRQLRAVMVRVPLAPPALVIRALGTAEVVSEGKLLTVSDWGTRDAREMFFCFLAFPDGLTKEEVAETLWTEISPDRLSGRFKNTLYRLRAAVGRDVVIYHKNRYRINPYLDYSYDLDTFETRVRQAQVASHRKDQIRAMKDAIDIYHGPYLPESDRIWVLTERERLNLMYTHMLSALGEIYLADQNFEDALVTGSKIVHHDPCQEIGYRLMMRAYALKGDREGVILQYERCKLLLDQEIGLPPSPETQALLEDLLN